MIRRSAKLLGSAALDGEDGNRGVTQMAKAIKAKIGPLEAGRRLDQRVAGVPTDGPWLVWLPAGSKELREAGGRRG